MAKRSAFSSMNRTQLLTTMRERVERYGCEALTYQSVQKERGLYHALYQAGLPLKEVIKELGLEETYQASKVRNAWQAVLEEVEPTVERNGHLPPAAWFQENGLSWVVARVYSCGKTWADLRERFDSFATSSFVESRNGMRWRSHPEASLSNFLYARGIGHRVGERYAEEYGDQATARYAYFDLHFQSSDGQWMDVEIWGEKPNGHAAKRYAQVRRDKERFNARNPLFLGIEFRDCFNESKLEAILEPYIGVVKPWIFEKPHDRVIPTTHWSNADELIEYCQEFAANQPNGVFPTEEWLRKRGKWAERDGPAYNTLSIYIKNWIGGIRKLRKILGQGEASTATWSVAKAKRAYRDWWKRYGFTASQARQRKDELSESEYKRARNIEAAVRKYCSSVQELNEELGIQSKKKTKWDADRILSETKRLHDSYGLTPSQISRLTQDDRALFGVTPDDLTMAGRIVDRCSSYFDGANCVYQQVGICPEDLRVLRRRRKQAKSLDS